jgi:hypothetical protein
LLKCIGLAQIGHKASTELGTVFELCVQNLRDEKDEG